MSIIKWIGSKRKLAPRIIETMGPIDHYCEPFGGSLAVFFALMERDDPLDMDESVVVLADINPRLMAMWKMIRDSPEQVIDELDQLPSGSGWREKYNDIREMFNGSRVHISDAKRAAILLWLNKTCFNGLYRENSRGEFNVPIGSYDNPSWVTAEEIWAASRLFEGTLLITDSFLQVMDKVSKPAGHSFVIYCDPPYVPLDANGFTAYSSGGFDDWHQKALATAAKICARRGCRVYISNHDTEYVREELYPSSDGFKVEWSTVMTRTVGASGSKKAGELLVSIGA